VAAMTKALTAAGAMAKVVAPHGGTLAGARGVKVPVDFSLVTVGSVLFDAVFVPGGAESAKALARDAMAVLFVNEAYKHCKAVAATGAGVALLPGGKKDGTPGKAGPLEEGFIAGGDGDVAKVAAEFIKAIGKHRAWSREPKGQQIAV